MVDLAVLPGFVVVILLFLLPPGPDMAFMVAVGLEGGRRPAVSAILGIGTGMTLYAAAVVVGVGRAAHAYPLLIEVVKVGGAAYLLWLGYGALRHARRATDRTGGTGGTGGDVPGTRPYRRGVVVSLTNPKVFLFFLAVLPQFIGAASSTASQLAVLGAVNVLVEVVLYGTIGVMAGSFHARFAASRRAETTLSLVAGAVYVLLGVVVLAEVATGAWPG